MRLNRLTLLFDTEHHLKSPKTFIELVPCHTADCSNRKITMKHLAAYLLLGLGGNTSPSAKDVKGVLESVGIDADDDRLNKLIEELKGKDLQEV